MDTPSRSWTASCTRNAVQRSHSSSLSPPCPLMRHCRRVPPTMFPESDEVEAFGAEGAGGQPVEREAVNSIGVSTASDAAASRAGRCPSVVDQPILGLPHFRWTCSLSLRCSGSCSCYMSHESRNKPEPSKRRQWRRTSRFWRSSWPLFSGTERGMAGWARVRRRYLRLRLPGSSDSSTRTACGDTRRGRRRRKTLQRVPSSTATRWWVLRSVSAVLNVLTD